MTLLYAGTNCSQNSTLSASGIGYVPFAAGSFPGYTGLFLGDVGSTGAPTTNVTNKLILATALASGAKVGLQSKDKVTHHYLDTGAGWTWYAGIYRGILVGGGKLGLNLVSTVARWDDFGGGGVPSVGHTLPYLHVGN
jgi:hypothetical protein